MSMVTKFKNILTSSTLSECSRKLNVSKFRLLSLFCIAKTVCGCTLKEFFDYELYDKNLIGIKQYMVKKINLELNLKYNDREQLKLIAEKEEMLHIFQKFTKRDFVGHKYNSTKDDYETFSAKHDRCIIKPNRGFGGRSVKIISIKADLNGESLYDFCHKNNAFAEELIVQHPKMSSLHPSSVNTLRIVMICGKPIAAALRIGCGGSDVDNATSGGFFAGVDLATGIVFTKGVNKKKVRIVKHPDTGTIIPGFEIPFFKEALKLCVDASKIIDKLKIIGWDVAITEDGPVMVEVNDIPGGYTQQVPDRKGIRCLVEDSLHFSTRHR